MTQDRIRVLLVDDEPLMRAGIQLMVDGVDGIEVVGEPQMATKPSRP